MTQKEAAVVYFQSIQLLTNEWKTKQHLFSLIFFFFFYIFCVLLVSSCTQFFDMPHLPYILRWVYIHTLLGRLNTKFTLNDMHSFINLMLRKTVIID